MKKLVILFLPLILITQSLGAECSPDRPLKRDYECHLCNELEAIATTEENCDKCPNRRMMLSMGKYRYGEELCALKECPEKSPMRDLELTCWWCSVEEQVRTNKEECDKCPERVFLNGICAKKCDSRTLMETGTGFCLPCGVTYNVSTPKTECDKCPNRVYKDGKCVFQFCPSDAPMKRTGVSLWGEFEECLSCEAQNLDISSEECAKCGDVRSFVHELCLFRKSIHKDRPLIGPDFGWTDGAGVQIIEFGCDVEKPLLTTKSNCDECPNRQYVDGKCILKEIR